MNIFTPDKFRLYSWSLLRFALGVLFLGIPIGVALLSLLTPNPNLGSFLYYTICAAVAGPVGILIGLEQAVTRMQIVITDETISGPSAWFARRVQFSPNTLDKEKSSKQSFFQWIFGYRLIQSKTGQTIMFAEKTFNKDQASKILDILGCARSGIA